MMSLLVRLQPLRACKLLPPTERSAKGTNALKATVTIGRTENHLDSKCCFSALV